MAKALNWKLLHNQYEEVQDYKDKVIFFHTKYLCIATYFTVFNKEKCLYASTSLGTFDGKVDTPLSKKEYFLWGIFKGRFIRDTLSQNINHL